MQLFYDQRDVAAHRAVGSKMLKWLDDVGATPLSDIDRDAVGFLFTGARPITDYQRLVARHPRLRDRPQEREPLLRLDGVLDAIDAAGIDVPMPLTWRLPLDAPLPVDLTFPLFVRTAHSSLKRGGHVSRVRTGAQLVAEAATLRRALGWDALILARSWCDLAQAGQGMFGPVPQEVRTWVVDGKPHAWSFHYLHVTPHPMGFPPSDADLSNLYELAQWVGRAFRSRLVAADFARDTSGHWIFIEAGPGSCAYTAHEHVFKAVAGALVGQPIEIAGDDVGGGFKTGASR